MLNCSFYRVSFLTGTPPISAPKRKLPSSQSQHRFYWNISCDWLICGFLFGTEIGGSQLKKTSCIRTFEQARKSYQPTKMFFETHKMMSHLLRCHRGDLISVGPIVSLSPTQGVFLTRSSNPPSCQRQECGRLPLYPSTRSCMQIYIAPPAAGPVWPNVQSGMLPGLLYKVPNPICLGNLFLSNGDPGMPWPGLPGIVIGWGTENISATLLPI